MGQSNEPEEPQSQNHGHSLLPENIISYSNIQPKNIGRGGLGGGSERKPSQVYENRVNINL